MISKSQIKDIQALQHKKYRQKLGRFLAEGPKIVGELLKEKFPVLQIFANDHWLRQHGSDLKNISAIDVIPVTDAELQKLSALSTPAEVLAVCALPDSPPAIRWKQQVVIALETIQDPGNLGTILRIADWFGIQQVCCSPDCADVYHPKTVQASMGSIARVQVWEVAIPALLTQSPLQSYAATLSGKSITDLPRLNEGILLIGNESRGLSKTVVDMADHQITIPRRGRAESLNAAVATGIICGRLLM